MAPHGVPIGDGVCGANSRPPAATIYLKTSMLVPGVHSEEFPLSESIATMRALILELGRRAKVDLIDRKGDLINFVDVKLNEKNINFFPDGLATRLRPGDRVLIRLIPIGGG